MTINKKQSIALIVIAVLLLGYLIFNELDKRDSRKKAEVLYKHMEGK